MEFFWASGNCAAILSANQTRSSDGRIDARIHEMANLLLAAAVARRERRGYHRALSVRGTAINSLVGGALAYVPICIENSCRVCGDRSGVGIGRCLCRHGERQLLV